MVEIIFEKVLYVSSENKKFPGDNLVQRKKWLCNAGETKAVIKLQFKNDCEIEKVEIGNEGSAFVKVLVGKLDMKEEEYKVLLTCSPFMNPVESQSGNNRCQVRMFTRDQLMKGASNLPWKVVKVVCTQPFNKKVGYGLSFLKLFGAEDTIPTSPTPPTSPATCGNPSDSKEQADLGVFKLKRNSTSTPTINIGSFFRRSREESRNGDNKQHCKKIKIDTDTNILKDSQNIRSSTTISSTTTTQQQKPLKSSEPSSANTHSSANTPTSKSPPATQPSLASSKSPTNISPPSSTNLSQPSTSTQNYSSKQLLKSFSKPQTNPQPTKPPQQPTKATTNAPQPSSSTTTSPHLKPLTEVLRGVVMVLSGFQNPERSDLRDMATSMGAVYHHDWSIEGSHLVCAFTDTPKYTQVSGKGRIVKKEWLLQCHRQHKLLPWKRYRLGKARSPKRSSIDDKEEDGDDNGKGDDNDDEKEEEEEDYEDSEDDFIVDDDDEESEDDTDDDDVCNDASSDDEIDNKKQLKKSKMHSRNKARKKASSRLSTHVLSAKRSTSPKALSTKSSPQSSPQPSSSSPQPSSPQPSSPQPSSSSPQPSSSSPQPSSPQPSSPQPSSPQPSSSSLPSSSCPYDKLISTILKLPSFLNKISIFLYGEFANSEKHFLTRYIMAYDGNVCDYMGEEVEVVITKDAWDANFDQALKDYPDIVFLKPEWLLECIKGQQLVPFLKEFQVIRPSEID